MEKGPKQPKSNANGPSGTTAPADSSGSSEAGHTRAGEEQQQQQPGRTQAAGDEHQQSDHLRAGDAQRSECDAEHSQRWRRRRYTMADVVMAATRASHLALDAAAPHTTTTTTRGPSPAGLASPSAASSHWQALQSVVQHGGARALRTRGSPLSSGSGATKRASGKENDGGATQSRSDRGDDAPPSHAHPPRQLRQSAPTLLVSNPTRQGATSSAPAARGSSATQAVVPTSSSAKPNAGGGGAASSTAAPLDVSSWDPRVHSVAEALFIRLCRAIENNESFRCVVVIPVHPDGPLRTVRAVQVRN